MTDPDFGLQNVQLCSEKQPFKFKMKNKQNKPLIFL